MDPADNSKAVSVFPMRILCTGCGTGYRIDGPMAFHCSHCGNHIRIRQDGMIEITPGKQPLRDAEELTISAKKQGDEVGQEGKIKETLKPERKIEVLFPQEEEEVVEIKAGKKTPAEEVQTALPVTEETKPEEKEEVAAEKKEESKAELEKEVKKEEVEKEEAGEEKVKKGEVEKEEVKKEEVGKEEEPPIPKEPVPPPKEPTPRPVEKAPTEPPTTPGPIKPIQKTAKKRAFIALGVVALILISVVGYAILAKEDFSVRMPGEKIGDRGTYDVKGRVWVSSQDGISVGSGVIQDLKINFKGQTWFQINETKEEKDGFGVKRNTVDKYLYQKLKLSGSGTFIGSYTEINDAGTIETKSSSYICLVTNDTIRNHLYNDMELDIPTWNMESIDKGIYYPSESRGDYNLFDLRQREYSLGDEGEFAGGGLHWKAEKKEKVYKWDTLKLHITENNSDANWRQLSGDVWVANECSLPVKVHIHMKIDTTKLPPTEQLLFKLITTSDGMVELDYTATMKGYIRGDKDIPWDPWGEDPTLTQRMGVQFDKDWKYVPEQRLLEVNGSFDPSFTAEFAVDYAINNSDDLESYIEKHKDVAYVVDGIYGIDNGTQSWQFIFGYREKGITTISIGYNITVRKTGAVLSIKDVGQEPINNPSNSRPDIDQALNIADSEGVFKEMELLSPVFVGEGEVQRIDFASGVRFEVQNNQLHTGLSLSGFNPLMQTTVPAGYGYYLQKEETGKEYYHLIEGMVDTQNGRIIYEVDHYQTGHV